MAASTNRIGEPRIAEIESAFSFLAFFSGSTTSYRFQCRAFIIRARVYTMPAVCNIWEAARFRVLLLCSSTRTRDPILFFHQFRTHK